LFSIDHGKRSPIINIAEAINAFNPMTSKFMKALDALGADAYTKPSSELNYIRALIESQARENPDYILLTLDRLAKDDGAAVSRIMTEYVRLVRKWGRGVSVCIDSKYPEVLAAGLKEWYNTGQPVRKPLLIAADLEDENEIFTLRSQFNYALATVLTDLSDKPTVAGLVNTAKEALKKYTRLGFTANDIFFELPIVPLSKDVPESPSDPSATHLAFETIKRIKADGGLKKTHCFVRVSIASVGMPRSIGVCRAFAARAMECGIDAGVVNVAHRYGFSPAAPAILSLIDAYAKADGKEGNHKELVEKADKFFSANKKAKAKKA
ncbi:MAG: hypothetical protein KAS23_06930, partial [Anaerohalosphaera sp.]|nr:hypothetical protein [Anaerohalosphaera sp.]